MTQTAKPAPQRRSKLRTILVVLFVLIFLLPLIGVLLIVWTSPAWLPLAGSALAERYGYRLTLDELELPDVGSLLNGDLLHDGIKLARLELADSNGLFTLEASRLRFDWSLDYGIDGSAGLTIGALEVSVDPSALGSDDESVSHRSPGEQLADMLRRLSQPSPDSARQLPGAIARYVPSMPTDFSILIDDLRVAAISRQYEQDPAWSGRLDISMTDHGMPAAKLTISSVGQLVLPAALRSFPAAAMQERPLFSAALAPAVPLTLNAVARPENVSLRIQSDYGVFDFKLLAVSPPNGSRWDLTMDGSLDATGLQPALLLPAQPPLTPTAVPLELTRGKLNLDAALRLDEKLLPLKQQPADAHLAADVDLEAGGGPGTLVWQQSLKLARGESDFTLELAPVKLGLDPVGVWWKTNKWFVDSGLGPAVLQPWTLRSKMMTCRSEPAAVDDVLEAASGVTGPALQKLLASCGWPLTLRLNTVVQSPSSDENALTFGLYPDFEAGADLKQDLLPKALKIKLSGTGTKLHAQMPAQWSLASSVRIRQGASGEGFDLRLADTSLDLQSLERPEITVDQLALQSRKLHLFLAASGALQSASGDIKGEITALAPATPFLSKPLAASFDTDFALKGSNSGPLPDMTFDLRSLSAAGLELEADLAIVQQLNRMSGDFSLSGTPDSQLMGALRDTLADALPQLPELKVKAGKLLYTGRLALNAESQPLQWSTSGIAGLQHWTITNEQTTASRVTLSTKIDADQSGMKILSDGESFSTLSADVSLGKLPFPGAFIKLAADLTFPAGMDSDELTQALSGTVELQQAHISAFKGDIELTDSVAIELPLTRMEKAPVRIPIALRSIDLGALVALENEHIDATGTVSGRLGLVYNGKSVRIPASTPGKLSADGSGWIRLKEAGQWQAMAGGNPQLLFAVGALRNFRYDSLKSTVVFDDNEWLNLALELQGSNPEVRDGRSIHYNLNVQSNILSLLRSLAVTENLSRSLEERVLKAYE